MSVRNFVRELSNVPSARSMLATQYNPRVVAAADNLSLSSLSGHSSVPAAATAGQHSNDSSDSWDASIKAKHGNTSLVDGIDVPFETNSIGSQSQQLTCMLTPRDLATSSRSIVSKELFIKLNNAGNRIFTTALLLSYRKQREQIRKLNKENEELRRKCWKYDQQAYVYQKLYDDEKERNYELQQKLRSSRNKAAEIRAKRETLLKSIDNLKTSNSLLEKQLHVQEEQFEGLQVSFGEVQSTLFKSMAQERELQRQLSEEQRRVHTLIVNESDLLLKLREHKKCTDIKKRNMWEQLQSKQASLAHYKQEKEALAAKLGGLLIKKTEFEVMGAELQNSLNEISQIKQNLQTLRQQLEDSWSNRLKRFWHNSCALRLRFAQIILVFGYCVLPSEHVARTSLYSKIPLRAIFG